MIGFVNLTCSYNNITSNQIRTARDTNYAYYRFVMDSATLVTNLVGVVSKIIDESTLTAVEWLARCWPAFKANASTIAKWATKAAAALGAIYGLEQIWEGLWFFDKHDRARGRHDLLASSAGKGGAMICLRRHAARSRSIQTPSRMTLR